MAKQKKRIEIPAAPVLETEAKVLLHSCCAPCSGAVVEWMVENGIRPTIYFSNSNIYPFEEYELRKAELIRYAKLFGLEVIDDDFNHSEWLESARPLAAEPERGKRCEACFLFRLRRAAKYAHEHGFNVLTTTLASSRWKDLKQVNAAGEAACASFDGVRWWGQNWRICGLQERRSEILREQQFYNQEFCGCEFSHRND